MSTMRLPRNAAAAADCSSCYPADRVEPCAKCKQPIAIGEHVHSYIGKQVFTMHHACVNSAAKAQPALPGAETVRETENPTPAYALPEQTPPAFALDGGTVPRAMLASLLIDEDEEK